MCRGWSLKKTIGFDSVVIYSHPPTFHFPIWDMGEDAAKYRRHVNQMFAVMRDEYIADSKKRRSSYSTQRGRSGPVEMRYSWAALRVCLGWTYDQIAEKYRVAPQSVREMVTKICDRIGLAG